MGSISAFGRTNAPAVGAELVHGALGYANLINAQKRLGLLEAEQAQETQLRTMQMNKLAQDEAYWSAPVSLELALKDTGPNEKKHLESLFQLSGYKQNDNGMWVDEKGLPPTRRGVKPIWDKLSTLKEPKTLTGHYEAVYLDAMKGLEKKGITPFEKTTYENQAREAWAKLAELKTMGKGPEETWSKSKPGPGGSLIQTSSTGKERAVLGREPKEGSAEGTQAFKDAKEAADFVLKFVPNMKPELALLLSTQPQLMGNPQMQALLNPQIPSHLRPIYDQMVRKLGAYWNADLGAKTFTYDREKGLIPDEGEE